MKHNLQDRLIDFASVCIQIKKLNYSSYEGIHLSKQLIRSSTSAALNYGEAKGAESQKDFIHKQSILLKELRESYINLLIIMKNAICKDPVLIDKAVDEANQLISIFVTSIKTAKRKLTNNET